MYLTSILTYFNTFQIITVPTGDMVLASMGEDVPIVYSVAECSGDPLADPDDCGLSHIAMCSVDSHDTSTQEATIQGSNGAVVVSANKIDHRVWPICNAGRNPRRQFTRSMFCCSSHDTSERWPGTCGERPTANASYLWRTKGHILGGVTCGRLCGRHRFP
jgi:hypothetical protein